MRYNVIDMNGRLLIAVVTTILDEALVIFMLVWGLPKLGIKLPVTVLVAIGIVWTGFAVLLYVSGSKILRKKPLAGQTDMIGFQGRVVKDLSPAGMIKINGELWAARSAAGNIRKNEEVEVESQDGLTLIVRKPKS